MSVSRIATDWVIACKQQLKKRHTSAVTHQTLNKAANLPPPVLEFNQATPTIPDDSPVFVEQYDTQLDTNPPQFEGDTEL